MIQQSYNLKDISTFKIGGPAEYYAETISEKDLLAAVKFAKEKNLKITVLGSASNVIISDDGVKGLVIRFSSNRISIKESTDSYTLLKAEAGLLWDEFVSICVEKGLYGVENLSNIPGTVGACGIQNIGAYGQQASDTIHTIYCYDLQQNEFVEIKGEDCQFGYRESIFNTTEKGRYIVCSVTFKLKKQAEFILGYRDMAYFRKDDGLTLRKVREEIIKIRQDKLPDYKEAPNVGSFFKNIELDKTEFLELIHKASILNKKYPEILQGFNFGTDKIKIPTALLIDLCELKAYKWDNIGICENHALILVNHSQNGTSKEVIDFSDFVISTVNKKLGVKIEREPAIVS
ncbi:MAG: UDP-N-acetylmuramate dehydrogenase [Proteobacteria bacterium]|nr:UDP-N-acetylmuramate dehydrogenase [Pseudomonadota bacterium]